MIRWGFVASTLLHVGLFAGLSSIETTTPTSTSPAIDRIEIEVVEAVALSAPVVPEPPSTSEPPPKEPPLKEALPPPKARAKPAKTPRPVAEAPQPLAPPSPSPTPAKPRRLGLTLSNEGALSETPGGEPTASGKSSGATAKTSKPATAAKDNKSGCKGTQAKPRPIQKVPLPYPREARAQGLEGKLVLRIKVDPEGKVSDVEVLRSVGRALDQAVREAVSRWRFTPAQECGRAVPGNYVIAPEFKLGD